MDEVASVCGYPSARCMGDAGGCTRSCELTFSRGMAQIPFSLSLYCEIAIHDRYHYGVVFPNPVAVHNMIVSVLFKVSMRFNLQK